MLIMHCSMLDLQERFKADQLNSEVCDGGIFA